MSAAAGAGDAQYRKMTQTPIPRLVTTLAVPTIISMLVTAVYNMADTFFVAQLGTSAAGAVGIVFSLMAVIQAIISKASSPAVLKNYQTLLSSLSDAFLTSLSYDDIAALVQMQLQNMSGWHVTSYAVSGSGDTSYCYALGDAAWVMRPNMDTVNTAKELIRQVMSGETPQLP